jgi:hypothetical protein
MKYFILIVTMLAIPILDGTSVEAANCKDQALVKKNSIKQGCDVLSPQGQEQKVCKYLFRCSQAFFRCQYIQISVMYCVSQICWTSMDLFFSSQSPVSYFEDWKMVTTIEILAWQSTRLPNTP